MRMRKAMLHVAAVFTVMFGSVASVAAVDYYVSPTGNDANSGTSLVTPFRTIQRAADVMTAGDTAHIRAGIYRETVVLTNAGTPGNPITFKPYNNEVVVISGADPITGWTQHAGDIWKANVGWDMGVEGRGNTLFVNGQLQYEARQGAENDLLDLNDWGRIPNGALQYDHFISSDITGWGNDYWNGAKITHHQTDWTITTRVIADYDSASGRITFADSDTYLSQKQDLGYYIFDTIKALDKPGEWFKDRSAGVLYYQALPGQNPNTLDIEFKKRHYGFDVRGKDYITIEGFEFRGTSIHADEFTDYNIYKGNTFFAYDKQQQSNALSDGFFRMYGNYNVFRDNEVYQTWDSVLFVDGKGNQIVNNYLHTIGYKGITRVLTMRGREHLVSHNTVKKYARSFLDGFPTQSVFAYNIFEDGGRLSWDTGVFDGDWNRGNGGGSIVHHNVFRNTNPAGIFMAFYSGLEFVAHHNIVYGFNGSQTWTMRTTQLNFNKYYHNTFIGRSPDYQGEGFPANIAIEVDYHNNMQVTADDVSALGINSKGNVNYSPSDFVNFAAHDFRLAQGSNAIDAGIVLPGVNDGYSGSAPDAGALEYGTQMWAVGHDFANPPNPTYDWVALPRTNIFDNGQFKDELTGWTNTGTPVYYDANTWNTKPRGLSIYGNSIQLQPGDGISRTIDGLQPNTWYTIGTETRIADQRVEMEQYSTVQGTVTTGFHRGEDFIEAFEPGESVTYASVDFGFAGKYDQLELSYSRVPATPYSTDTASLEVYSGSLLLGEFQFHPAVQDVWWVSHIDIPQLSGIHTLTLRPRGTGNTVMRYANIRLMQTNPSPENRLTLEVTNYGGADLQTRIGTAYWNDRYDRLLFRTGQGSTAATISFMNNGVYDTYLDRLAVFESPERGGNSADQGTASQSSTSGSNVAANAIDGNPGTSSRTSNTGTSSWEIDLGERRDIYALKLIAPLAAPGELSNFRVSLIEESGGAVLWQRNYLTTATLGPGEMLYLKGTDLSDNGMELQDAVAQIVKIELLGTNGIGTGHLSIGELEVIEYDEMDLVESDGTVTETGNRWMASFTQAINIGEIKIDNVDTPNYRELSNFRVAVWDRDPNDGGTMLWQNVFFPSSSVGRGETFTISGDEIALNGSTRIGSTKGIVVTVENNGINAAGNTNLSLARVRIHHSKDFSPPSNVARFGEVTQSSIRYFNNRYPENLINGIMLLDDTDINHTNSDPQAWTQIDLKQDVTIQQLVIMNNNAGTASRIGNFRVSVWDSNPETGGTELWGRNYSYAAGDIPMGGALTINGSAMGSGTRLNEITNARFVRVQLLGTNFLHLTEIQVWTNVGTDPPPPTGDFTDSFENGFGNWVVAQGTATASSTQNRHGIYSYALDEDQDGISRTFTTHQRDATVWFYDDASDTDMAVLAFAQAPGFTRGIGVQTSISTDKYVFRVDGVVTSTNITRTTGWHKFTFDYSSGTHVDMYIDDVLVASPAGLGYFTTFSLADWWAGGTMGNVYFDDVSINEFDVPPPVGDFTESFENGFGAWNVNQGTATVSSAQNRHGSYAYELNEDQDGISRTFTANQKEAIIWFYDDASDTSLAVFAFAQAPGFTRALGVNTSVSANTYVYRVDGVMTATTITRTTGWHELRFDYSSGTRCDMYINGVLVASPTGLGFFNSLSLADWWAGGTLGTVYFDDISVNAF